MASTGTRIPRWSFLFSAVLLSAHEVDSGCWREWELFGLPGGAPLFVFLHLGIFFLLFWGYGEVVKETRAGLWMSFAVAGSALFAAGLHGVLLLLGRPGFTGPVSVGLLLLLALSGALQLAMPLVRSTSSLRPTVR